MNDDVPPIIYDIPTDACVGGIALPSGKFSVGEIADILTASYRSLPGGVNATVTRGNLMAFGIPDVVFTGPARKGSARRPFVVGRSRLYRSVEPLDDDPGARRHHAPDCRWKPRKAGGYRGWLCSPSCRIPALLDADAAADD